MPSLTSLTIVEALKDNIHDNYFITRFNNTITCNERMKKGHKRTPTKITVYTIGDGLINVSIYKGDGRKYYCDYADITTAINDIISFVKDKHNKVLKSYTWHRTEQRYSFNYLNY